MTFDPQSVRPWWFCSEAMCFKTNSHRTSHLKEASHQTCGHFRSSPLPIKTHDQADPPSEHADPFREVRKYKRSLFMLLFSVDGTAALRHRKKDMGLFSGSEQWRCLARAFWVLSPNVLLFSPCLTEPPSDRNGGSRVISRRP